MTADLEAHATEQVIIRAPRHIVRTYLFLSRCILLTTLTKLIPIISSYIRLFASANTWFTGSMNVLYVVTVV